MKDLVVTRSLPGAPVRTTVKIPGITFCPNLRWGQLSSGSALDIVLKFAHNGISLAGMSFDLEPARRFRHPLQQRGNKEEGKATDVEEHAPSHIL